MSLRAAGRTLHAAARELLALRWVRVAAWLALIVVALRLCAEPLLRLAVGRAAAARELECDWEDLDLRLLEGSGSVRQLRIASVAADGAAPPEALIEIEYAVFDLDVSALLLGDLRITRAEVDGLVSRWIRDMDGTWNVERHVRAAELLELLESPEEPGESSGPVVEPIELAPPLAIDALRLQAARLSIVDRTLDPPAQLWLEVNAALSDLRADERPARFSATLTAEDLLDGAHIEGEATWAPDGLRARARVQAGGLRAARLAPWLAPFDLRPACSELGARGRFELALDVLGEARDGLAAQVSVSELALVADGAEVLALDRFSLTLEELLARGAKLPGIEISGVRGSIELLPGEIVRLAGLEVTGSNWQEPAADWLRTLLPEWRGLPLWAALLVHPDDSAYPWRLDRLSLGDSRFELTDRRVDPPALVPLIVERIELEGLVHDPAHVDAQVPVRVELSAPGVAERITLQGSLDPFAPRRHVQLQLDVDGIAPTALDGWLRRAGLERRLEHGSFALTLEGDAVTDPEGRTTGRLEVNGVSLREEGDLFGVQRVAAEGLSIDPNRRVLRAESIEIEAPQLALGRDPTQGFFALGLRTLGLAAPAAPSEAAAQAARTGSVAALPAADEPPPLRLELGRLTWSHSRLTWLDEALAELPEGSQALRLDDLSFQLEGLVLDGDPAAPAPEPARLSGRLAAAGLVDELELDGLVHSTPGRLDLRAQLELRGRGLSGRGLAPYLRPFGVEPALDAATLSLDLDARLTQDEALAWRAAVEIARLRLEDGGRSLAELERAAVSEVELGEATRVGEVSLEGLSLELAREAEGGLLLPGLRLLPRDVAPANDATAPALPALAWPELPPLSIERLSLSGARLSWTDASLSPPLATQLRLDLEALDLDTRGAMGTFAAQLSIPGALERLSLDGRASLGPEGLLTALELEGHGLTGSALARLLPAGVALETVPATLRAKLEARLAPVAGGGLAARFAASDVWLGPRAGPAWFACTQAVLELLLDPVRGALDVAAANATGLEIAARADEAGAVHAVGLVLSPALPDRSQPQDEPEAVAAPAGQRALPRLAVTGDVSVDVTRFSWSDERLGPEALPFECALQATLETPALILGTPSEQPQPLSLAVQASVAGLVERIELACRIAPWAAEPQLELDLAARGLRTQGLVERLPVLAGRVEGTLEEGALDVRARGTLHVRRAGHGDLGLARPFGAELALEEFALRESPEGPVLVGIGSALAECSRIDLAGALVRVDSLEIQRPQARLARGSDGRLHAFGFALTLQAPPASPETTQPAPAAEAPAPPPTGEVRIDQVLVSGIDVALSDDSVEPPMRVQVGELDLELAGLSTRALVEPRPLRFSATLGASPTFEELSIAGRAALYPELEGWAQVTLSGLELEPLSGLAAAQGLELEDGALDTSTRLRLGPSSVRVDTSLVFSDLALSEPEGGWLERTLSLPVALDSALFLLRNADGEHRFSTGITLTPGGLSTSQLAAAGTRAAAEVLARALAGAPLRLLGALVPLGGDEEPPARAVWEFAFAEGATELADGDVASLIEVARRLESDRGLAAVLRCELSAADLARAERLANPPPQDCLALVQRLRRRKAELERRHAELAVAARVQLSVGASESERTREELRAVGRELSALERTLDALLEILRSDAPRRRDKRTRATLREIAELRLEAVRAALEPRLERSALERLELRSPRAEAQPELPQGRVVLELRER